MKALISLGLIAVVLFSTAFRCAARSTDDCPEVREEISRLEQIDVSTLPHSLQQIYKENLLKLYKRFAECLQQDLSAAADSAQKSIIRKQITDNQNKITVLQIALKSGSDEGPSTESATSANMPSVRNSSASDGDGTGSSARAPRANRTRANATTRSDAAADASAGTPQPVGSQTPSSVCANVAPGADYPDPPPILLDIANKAAADVVRRNDPVRAIFPLTQMVLYTVFDSASANSSKMLRELEAYDYLSETARTDKQLGGSANSDGAVSAIEKPSFARLLGFAIEHGAINKRNDGTNLTLSTSLYSLYAINGGDTAATYERAGFLSRIGVAATFAVDNQTNELANARRNNLSQWSVKARLFGDRSTRAPGFRRFWNEKVRPLISERLQSLGSAVESLSQRLDSYDAIERASRRCLPDIVKARMAESDFTSANEEAKKTMVAATILSHLRANVYDRIKSGTLKLESTDIANIESDFLPRLKSALDNLVLVDAEVKKQINNLQKGPLATFAYTNYRNPNGSDYSETKFLFEQDQTVFRPLKLNGNFGLTFYNKPDPTLNQKKLRDISAALSFEGTSRSPFTEAENQSKITYSFVGRYQRLFENRRSATRKPDIGTFQFVMEIPFFKGLSLPLSATYANGTEQEKKNHFRFNFGMRLDTDKLFDLLKAAGNR